MERTSPAHLAAIDEAKRDIEKGNLKFGTNKKYKHAVFDEQSTLEKWHAENDLIDEHSKRMADFLSSIPPQPRVSKKKRGRR